MSENYFKLLRRCKWLILENQLIILYYDISICSEIIYYSEIDSCRELLMENTDCWSQQGIEQ